LFRSVRESHASELLKRSFFIDIRYNKCRDKW